MKRTFVQTLDTLRYGELTSELDKNLRELVLACTGANKGGELVLKIKLKPTKSGAIDLIDEVSMKLPKQDKGTTLMFPTVEGHLQRNDPAQGELEGIRSVVSDERPIQRAAG